MRMSVVVYYNHTIISDWGFSQVPAIYHLLSHSWIWGYMVSIEGGMKETSHQICAHDGCICRKVDDFMQPCIKKCVMFQPFFQSSRNVISPSFTFLYLEFQKLILSNEFEFQMVRCISFLAFYEIWLQRDHVNWYIFSYVAMSFWNSECCDCLGKMGTWWNILINMHKNWRVLFDAALYGFMVISINITTFQLADVTRQYQHIQWFTIIYKINVKMLSFSSLFGRNCHDKCIAISTNMTSMGLVICEKRGFDNLEKMSNGFCMVTPMAVR